MTAVLRSGGAYVDPGVRGGQTTGRHPQIRNTHIGNQSDSGLTLPGLARINVLVSRNVRSPRALDITVLLHISSK